MAPKSKKGPKNGFFYFMQDVKRREESKGRTFSSMKEVADFASSFWNRLDLEQREVYNAMSKEAKGGNDSDHHKFTSLGVSYATVDAEVRESREAHHIMVHTVKNTVRSLTSSTLLTHRFYLCHANHFYRSDRDFYSIAELALSVFNLQDGLIDRIHFFVDPGKIPTGFRYEAKDWSEKTHCIPLDWDQGEKDYCKIFMTIKNFLKKDKFGSIPPVYSMPDCLNSNTCISAVTCAFNSLCEASNENPNQFRIYPLTQLFYELRNRCAESSKGVCPIPSVAIAQNEIEKDVFSYAQNLSCEFHEENDRPIYCSLSVVTRWVYGICDHCCKHVGISLELGKHCPMDADVNWDYKLARICQKPVEEPEPDKSKNSFMPTIIDHGKLKEERERQFYEDQENLRKAADIRPPRSSPRRFIVPNANRLAESEELSPAFNNLHISNDEKEANTEHGLRNNETADARGYRRAPDETAWPISGRGRFLRK